MLNHFKFWRWNVLYRMKRGTYLSVFTTLWTVINISIGVYRERILMGWAWEEILEFQLQIILFIMMSGLTIAWVTWDARDHNYDIIQHNHILDTDRLVLRRIEQTDLKSLYKLLLAQDIKNKLPGILSKNDIQNWMLKNVQSYMQNGYGRYIVERKNSHDVVGICGFKLMNIDGFMEVDLACIIGSAEQSRGYGSEILKACLEYGLKELDFQRIVMRIPNDQTACSHLAEKIGLIKNKTFQDNNNDDILSTLYIIKKDQLYT